MHSHGCPDLNQGITSEVGGRCDNGHGESVGCQRLPLFAPHSADKPFPFAFCLCVCISAHKTHTITC